MEFRSLSKIHCISFKSLHLYYIRPTEPINVKWKCLAIVRACMRACEGKTQSDSSDLSIEYLNPSESWIMAHFLVVKQCHHYLQKENRKTYTHTPLPTNDNKRLFRIFFLYTFDATVSCHFVRYRPNIYSFYLKD